MAKNNQYINIRRDFEKIIEMAIKTKRDIQTIEPICCKKCKIKPYISETMSRDRYKVSCLCCGAKTEWFGKIDDCVMSWNNMMNIK